MATTFATEKQADAIKQRMAEIRTELPYKADDARVRVKQLTDWTYHVAKHPLPILAVSAVVGYMIVPSKNTRERVVVEQSPNEQAPTAPGKKGVVSGIVGLVATLALKQASTFAANEVTNLFSRRENS